MTVTPAKWSLDEYHQMINAGVLVGRRVELLNGEIIEMAPEGPEQAQMSRGHDRVGAAAIALQLANPND